MSARNIQRIEEVPVLPARPRDAHKGSFGRVLVIGGSRGMIGAPALAGTAALRAGAGLVTLALPAAVQLASAALCPCATSLPLACTESGDLAGEGVSEAMRAAAAADVLAVGPGLAVGGPQRTLVQAVLEQSLPAVVDADALNNLADIVGWAARRRCPLVLTPHPGEMARLIGRPVRDIQADREGIAIEAVTRWAADSPGGAGPLVLVLKGAGTVVTDGRQIFINDSGNPGMATGGAGDILTGVIAALIGQGMDLLDAAVLGVHAHGLAGDIAASEIGEISLIASDLSDYLPDAFGELMGEE